MGYIESMRNEIRMAEEVKTLQKPDSYLENIKDKLEETLGTFDWYNKLNKNKNEQV